MASPRRGASRLDPHPSRRHPLRGRRLTYEALEQRRLLAIDVQVRFEFATPGGQPLPELHVGDNFLLNAYVQDVRASAAGVFQAYLDVNYGAGVVSNTGDVMHGAFYNAATAGSVAVPGLIDDAGGLDTDQVAPVPTSAELLLFSVPFHANAAGQLSLSAALPQSPVRQLVLFDKVGGTPIENIQFVGGSIEISPTPTPKVSIATTQGGSEAGPVGGVFTVSQSIATGTNTVIQYSVGGTATAGSDYTSLSGTATIVAGQTSTTISVPVINDPVVEASETVIVTLNAISQGDPSVSIDTGANQATLNITDNDSAQVSIAATTGGNETGPANGRFTVTQTAASSTNTVISFSLAGSAIAGSDYTPISTSVTILAGNTTATIDVPVIDDASVEGPETVMVTLTGILSGDPQIALEGGATQATLSIADNDTALVRVAPTTAGNEAGPIAAVFTVTQTAASPSNTVVTYSLSGTATAGSDYTAPSGSVTIVAGMTSATITVPVTNDPIVEGDETVILTLGTITSGNPQVSIDPAQNQATIAIADNDSAQVRIAKTTDGNESGPVNGVFTVTQTAVSSTATVILYTVNGTASPGSDYTALSGTVTIPAGQTTATIPVAVIDDAVAEPTETVIVTLNSITSGDPQVSIDTGQNQATLTIADNEAPVVRIVKTADASEAGPAGGLFTISQTIVTPSDTIISYTVNGTASSGSDFAPLSGTVTIPAGQTSAPIEVDVTDDQLIEGAETVIVTLTQITQGDASLQLDATNSQATLSIADDETGRVGIETTNDGSETGPAAGLFTVTQDGMAAVDTVISYSTAGSAAPGDDYTALSGTVTIVAGQTSATISVAVTDDAIVEPSETVIVTLTGITSGSPLVAIDPQQQQATVAIADNDTAQVRIDSAGGGSEDSPTGGSFTIVQSAPSSTDTVIQYVVSGTATSGVDHGLASGTVVIPAGQTQVVLAVPVIDDAVVELTETVTLNLVSLDTGGAAVTIDSSNAEATIEITDNDSAMVSVERTSHGGEAGPVNVVFTVRLTAPSSTDTALEFTLGGTATGGSDYTAIIGPVIVPAGSTSQVVIVEVLDDLLLEGGETATITLDSISGGHPAITINELLDDASADIADNETGLVRFDTTIQGAESGPTPGQVTVSQSGITDVDTVITYAVTGTATAGEDYLAPSGTVTIPAGQTSATIDLSVLNDLRIEGTEFADVTFVEITSGDGRLAIDSSAAGASVPILDDDTGLVSIAPGDNASEIGPASGTFLVTQSGIADVDTVIAYSVAGTATMGIDFSQLSGTVTIAAGETTATIAVPALDDSLVEAAETVMITLTGITSGSEPVSVDGDNDTATITIADNDAAQVSLSATTGGSESGPTSAVFTVTQSALSSTVTVISYTVGGTATSGSDYTALSGTVTILAGQTTATITVPVIDDTTVEGTETITLVLTDVSSGGAITIDDAADSAALEIADNDNAAISFAAATSSVLEPVGSHTVIVRLSIPGGGTLAQSVTVNVAATGGTATAADFSLATSSVTFAAGTSDDAQQTVTLTINDDDLLELEETVVLGLTIGADGTGGRAAIGNIPSHTVTIVDDPGTGVISGFVWADTNFNGRQDADEIRIPGVAIRLVGVDGLGQPVEKTTTTNSNGDYAFGNLMIGTYDVIEQHPQAFNDGGESLGTVDGAASGTVGNDRFTGIQMSAGGQGINYNFGEAGLHAQYVNVRFFLATTPKHDFILRDTMFAADARVAAINAALSLAAQSAPLAAPQVAASSAAPLAAPLPSNSAPQVVATVAQVATAASAVAEAEHELISPAAADASMRDFLASEQSEPLVDTEADMAAVAFATTLADSSSAVDSANAAVQPASPSEDGPQAEPSAAAMLLEDSANDRGIAGGPLDSSADGEQSADAAFDADEFWLEALVV